MQDSNIRIGFGFQSVEGTCVAPIIASEYLKPADPNEKSKTKPTAWATTHQTRFSYQASFISSKSEVQKKLAGSLGVSANLYNASAELRASFEHITSSNDNSGYYYIELRRETAQQTLNVYEADKFISLGEQYHTLGEQKFYEKYGDRVVCEVNHGEKLVALVEINNTSNSLISKLNGALNVSAPHFAGIKAEIEKSTSTLQEASRAGIHIFSIGSTSPKVHIELIHEMQELNQLLNNFGKSNSAGESSKKSDRPSPSSITESTDPSKISGSIIGFKCGSFESVLGLNNKTERTGVNDKYKIDDYLKDYKNLLIKTNRANRFLDNLFRCRARVIRFINDIRKISQFHECANLTVEKRKVLNNIVEQLNKILKDISHLAKNITRNKFSNDDRFWVDKWNEIKQIASKLDVYLLKCDANFIDLENSAILVGKFESYFFPRTLSFIHKRSSSYTSMKVPFETKKLMFMTRGLPEGTKILFDLIRKHSIHIYGNEGKHHTIFNDLEPGILKSPVLINLDAANQAIASQNGDGRFLSRIPKKERVALTDKYNAKPYHHVAIANPRIIFGESHLNSNKTFTVEVYAQIGPSLQALNYADKQQPVGRADLQAFSFYTISEPVFDEETQQTSSPNSPSSPPAPDLMEKTQLTLDAQLKVKQTSPSKPATSSNTLQLRSANPAFSNNVAFWTEENGGNENTELMPWDYTDDQFHILLDYYIKDQKVQKFNWRYMSDNVLKRDLIQFNTRRDEILTSGQYNDIINKVIIIVDLPNHKRALVFISYQMNDMQPPKIYYVTPYGQNTHTYIEATIGSIYKNSKLIPYDLYKQKDGYNNAPWILEAVRCLLTQGHLDTLSELNIQEVKERQQELLTQLISEQIFDFRDSILPTTPT